MSDKELTELVKRFFNEELTQAEREKLSIWIQESGSDLEIKKKMEQAWEEFTPKQTLPDSKSSSLLKAIFQKITASSNIKHGRPHFKQENFSGKSIKLVRNKFYRWGAAASIILLLSFPLYYWMTENEESDIVSENIEQDIAPPKTLDAVLTLGNGEQIVLNDQSASGLLAKEGEINISRHADGEIEYQSTDTDKHEVEVSYHTITVPKGSKTLQLELSDGTKVWMNSASILRYPNFFVGNERKVEITGEAYFEVAKNDDMPFIVNVNSRANIKVLGTHFNVNAYEDESRIKTTLLEGSIKILSLSTNLELMINPGEQATLDAQNNLNVETVDISESIAWKNGFFDFNNADIQTVMRSLARWYDLEIQYKKLIKERFYIKISRDTNISSVFEILQKTGAVNFRIEGKKITII